MAVVPFGEAAILNDGRLVVMPWNAPGCYVGMTLLSSPVLRMPDATIDMQGRVWIVAHDQIDTRVRVCCQPFGVWWLLPTSGYGTRTIIRAVLNGVQVAYTTSPTSWASFAVSDAGVIAPLGSGTIPSGEGAHGMRDWTLDGTPRPLAPLDQVENGYLVRSVVSHGDTSIACALGTLPDQVLLLRGPQIGTLVRGGIDWPTPRLSSDGTRWCGVDYAHMTIRSGTIPAVVPPLMTTIPLPPEPPVPMAKATIDSFETPIVFGGSSRAVARAIQGIPEQYRWQFQDALGIWQTAATNPATDLDHRYSSGLTGSFRAPGHYAIRLQTLVHGAVTDTSSSTSRIIVVDPVTVPPIPPEPYPPNPPTPGPGEIVVHLTDMLSERPIQDADAWAQQAPAVVRETDANGYVVLKATASGVCVRKDGYHSPGLPNQIETCKLIAPLVQLVLERIPPPPLPTPDIHAAGKIFRDAANTPWRYKGVSGFKLGNLFETGQNIKPFLDAYRGFNVIRVWAYTDWAGTGWARPTSVDAVKDFLQFVAEYSGHLIEYTYVTNDSAEAHDWASGFVQALYSGPRPRLFNEIRNEPQTHSQTISTKRCKPAFDASGAVYASGNYEHSENAFGGYLVAHTQRDSEWPRRCHDLMEYFEGHGPHNTSEPAHRVPCVADEPAKTQDVAPPNAPLTKADDWRAYFGGCALLGAGATFHSETGKWGLPPTAEEAALASAALEGLDAFPVDAPLGNYSRPSDSSLRTYVVGPYMVRIRPTTDAPFGAWTRIGTSRVLWKR